MKIRYYGYNSFVVFSDGKKIAIDPGGSFYLPDFFKTNIPKSEWENTTHIIVTHGDPDHHWHTDKMAKASNAVVICNQEMVRNVNGRTLMIGPRDSGLAFTTPFDNLQTLQVSETIQAGGIDVTGFRGQHGSLTVKVGPFQKTLHPGQDERIGWGEMVFLINVDGINLVNFGDTRLIENAWDAIESPDVAMIPIGGHTAMNVDEALHVIQLIKPKVVIPCHYNTPALFSKKQACADDAFFQAEVNKLGAVCMLMNPGNEIEFSPEFEAALV